MKNEYSPELADILASHKDSLITGKRLCQVQIKAIDAIIKCRTSALGDHWDECDSCGHTRVSYNSCRNRNCPKCQQSKQIVWADKIKASIIPVKHFHLVFTFPDVLNLLFYINQKDCYAMLFKAAAEALKKTMKHYLKVESGAIAVLHTNGQTLNYHPHIHMIVPAGGIDTDGMQWIHTNSKFLVPVKAISAVFRAVLCQLIRKQWQNNKLIIPERFSPDFDVLKKVLYKTNWNVFVEKPLNGPAQIINYLGRYINRVAIYNNRIKNYTDGKVTFSYTDNKTNTFYRLMTLKDTDFINRFLQHILPYGFYKIRYYGIYAQINSDIRTQCFALLDEAPFFPSFESIPLSEVIRTVTGLDTSFCPVCKKGRMIRKLKASACCNSFT
jgi:hypothetical protein